MAGIADLFNSLSPQEQSLIDYHRKHLRDGTYMMGDKGLTSVYIQGVTGPDGRIYNVPGYFDGAIHNEQESAQRAGKLGWNLFPSYPNTPVPNMQDHPANVAARKLHGIIEEDGNTFMRAPPYVP